MKLIMCISLFDINYFSRRYINYIFGEEYTPGAFVNDGEFIEVMCIGGTAMNVSMTFDYSNSCNNTKWMKKWISFPDCQSMKFVSF